MKIGKDFTAKSEMIMLKNIKYQSDNRRHVVDCAKFWSRWYFKSHKNVCIKYDTAGFI